MLSTLNTSRLFQCRYLGGGRRSAAARQPTQAHDRCGNRPRAKARALSILQLLISSPAAPWHRENPRREKDTAPSWAMVSLRTPTLEQTLLRQGSRKRTGRAGVEADGMATRRAPGLDGGDRIGGAKSKSSGLCCEGAGERKQETNARN